MINGVGYQVVKGLISKDAALTAAISFEVLRINTLLTANIPLDSTTAFNDKVKHSFTWYAPYISEALLLYLHPRVQEIVGKTLYPTYSYARIYWPGAVLEEHIDRPSCEYSVTLTLEDDGSEFWPIWFKQTDGKEIPIVLEEGDGCVYEGTKLPHWRTEYKGKRQIQAFLHYVDANGPYADHKFDKRLFVGRPNVNP